MIKTISLSLLLAFLLSCTSKTENKTAEISRYHYPDVLQMAAHIHRPQQEALGAFSDLGTWHAFSLNEEKQTDNIGGFVGPYLMRQQQSFWLSPSFLSLQLKDVDSGELLDLSTASAVKNTGYPGMLEQSFTIADWQITLRLFNCNERTSLIAAQIENRGSQRQLQIGWAGTLFAETDYHLEETRQGMQVRIADDESVQVIFEQKDMLKDLNDQRYSAWGDTLSIDRSELVEQAVAFTYTFTPKEAQKYRQLAAESLPKSTELFAANEQRWNRYIKQLLQPNPQALLDVANYDRLAVKSLITLMHNWRTAAGSIFHQGIVPSYSANYFQGFWAWDSWKHAVAIAPFESELAKDQIRAMYDYQEEQGMIVDCFFRDLNIEGVNRRNTKAPLSGWSIYEVYRASGDKAFLQEMFPKLEKYHAWWYANRDHNQNGLCEYGSTDGTRIAAAWESGMDNAVRFDQAVILKNHEGAHSLNQESVDLNAYLYREKIYLQMMAAELGKTTDAKQYEQQAEKLKTQISRLMYDPADGFFYDISLPSTAQIKIQGPEGWSPLYNRLASPEQAEQVVKIITDTTKFNTPMPFPTLSADHPEFNPQKGYWRGPVWIDQAYFALTGMRNYGFEKEAKQMAEKLVNSAEGLANTNAPIRENYHPMSKEGLNAYNFSWSAAHILMLFNPK